VTDTVGIKIPQGLARARLLEAFEWAISDRRVPYDWTQFARQTFEMTSKTYTPALGTVLLAKATDDRVDPFSIKAEYSQNTYSMRTLCHGVLVPAAQQLGFSIRNTGREPLNNQPFFRYDHMSEIERVRNRAEHDHFMADLEGIEGADSSAALAALAAFLRVAIHEQKRFENYTIDDGQLTVDWLSESIDAFLSDNVDRPRRTQALVAGAFDVVYTDVRSRRINDPSRDYPGDVQVFNGQHPLLSVEVRAKRVLPTEVAAFARACRNSGIERAFVVVLTPFHEALAVAELRRAALEDYGVLLTVIETHDHLLDEVLAWSSHPFSVALRTFAEAVLRRLIEIEADPISPSRWVELIRLGE
jgi:SacI restriction endonuclease